MTVYRCDCNRCLNKIELHDGVHEGIYCKPRIEINEGVYIEPGHAGTKDDPDPICCDHYIEGPKPQKRRQQENG